MKRDEMIQAIAARMKILNLQDFNSFADGELPVYYFAIKLAETALETAEIEGMIPPFDYSETYYSSEEPAGYHPNRWEDDDEI